MVWSCLITANICILQSEGILLVNISCIINLATDLTTSMKYKNIIDDD